MAKVTISIARENGTMINASGDVPDALIVDTAAMLGAMLFEASAVAAEPTP